MKNRFLISGVVLLISLFLIIHSCKKDKTILPVITTAAVTEIAQTTATSGGDIIEISGSSILSKGVCWSTSHDPTIDNSKTTESGTLGAFVSKLIQLTPNTMYYVRAYAISNVVTGYGNQVSFTTSQAGVPVLTTAPITSVTQTSAVSGGLITNDGGATITARGVCWSTSSNPTTANLKTTDGPVYGSFTSSLSGLTVGTTYYVRAYATNTAGTAYGNQISFTTSAACASFIKVHTTGDDVTPVTKTITYGAVETNLSGAYKCWITQNLGADNEAGSATDNTEASAGWYWQFNRKQGYKHDGANRTPGTAWITAINESSSWTQANDPCTNLLGSGWRIPTATEWINAEEGWDNYTNTYASVLKIHAAGLLNDFDGSLVFRGSAGAYWSTGQGQYTYLGVSLRITSTTSSISGDTQKASGFSVRCLRD